MWLKFGKSGSVWRRNLILVGAAWLRPEELFLLVHIIAGACRRGDLRAAHCIHRGVNCFHSRAHVIVLRHKVALEVSDASLIRSIEVSRCISGAGANWLSLG